jgi:hypothetical protein
MIRYRLRCKESHEFEGWFRNSADYDRQARRRLIACPECGATKVGKALMTPGIATRRSRAPAPAAQTEAKEEPKTATTPVANPEAIKRAEVQKELLALMRHVRSEVVKNADYVGSNFASEARKIHYEEAPARGIYGEATVDEAKELRDEGIDCLPLPKLPEDHN